MEKLTLSLQALSAGGAGGETTDPAKDLTPALDSTIASRLSLETLPVEIQRLILSKVPGHQALSAIVHASPQFHCVYAEHRVSILRLVLAETLKGMVIEAVGAYRSGTDSFQKTRTEPLLWSFVEELKEKYTAPADWTTELFFDDLIHLLRFHESVIEPLTERYASWALASLPRSSEAGDRQHPLSDTERHCIQRAVYRLQIFCHLCGSLGEGRSSPTRIEENIDHLRILLIFQPWKVEEILNIHALAKDTYAEVRITAVNEDLLLVSDDGTEGGYIKPESLEAVLRHGLQVLYDTLSTQRHERLVERMRTAIETGMRGHSGFYINDWMEDTVDSLVQEDRREKWYSPRDSAQDRRQKMPFEGDRLDLPPLGWVLLWKAEYSNLVGNNVPFPLRPWGFVMWDAARLTLEAKDHIEFWFMQVWGPHDPREDDYDPSVAGPEYGTEGDVICTAFPLYSGCDQFF